MHAGETVGEDPAIEVAVEIAADETRKPRLPPLVRTREEGLEVAQEHLMKRSTLGLATPARTSQL